MGAGLALAREIGWVGRGWSDDTALLCAWTRLLAGVVRDHTTLANCGYPDEVNGWSRLIVASSDGDMVSTCKEMRARISALDSNDGWATDRAGAALEAVCLGGSIGISDQEKSRWPAAASQTVWAFVVGTGLVNGNGVVTLSRAAWQRHIFGQALAATQ